MNPRRMNRNRVGALVFAVAAAFLITSVITRVISDTVTVWTLATAMLAVADIAAVRYFWNRKPTTKPQPDLYGDEQPNLTKMDREWLDEQARLAGLTVKTQKQLGSWETTLGTAQPWGDMLITRVRFFEDTEGAHAVITDADGEGTIINWHRGTGKRRHPPKSALWLNQLINHWVWHRTRKPGDEPTVQGWYTKDIEAEPPAGDTG